MSRLEDLRPNAAVKGNLTGLLIRPDRATKQQEEDVAPFPLPGSNGGVTPGGDAEVTPPGPAGTGPACPTAPGRPKRYYGTVVLDSARVGRDASRVADEVISHLGGLVGAKVKVTLEIEAQMPNGASEKVVRGVTENGRTLKFASQGFEQDQP